MREWFSQTLGAATQNGRIGAMEGLRGFAVLLVFLVHHHTLFGGYLPPASLIIQISRFTHTIGNSGVDLFFVLSGYLVYGQVIRKSFSLIVFLRRRVRRIYPTFLVVFTVYWVLSHLIHQGSKIPQGVGAEALYVLQNLLFVPGIFPIEPLITVAWSLSYEVAFYLSIPLIVGLTGMREWSRVSRVGFFVALMLVPWVGSELDILHHDRLSGFAAGILLYEMFQSAWTATRLSRRGEAIAISLYIVAAAGTGWWVRGLGIGGYLSHPVSWAIFWAIAFPGITLYAIGFDGMLNRLFTFTPLRWLGNMSYSYFLIHGIVLNGVLFLAGRIIPAQTYSISLFMGFLAVNLVLTVATALLLFVVVEKPLSLAVEPAHRNTADCSERETIARVSVS
jgi:peptidoglycan/LPS O-acetylase OafA/YrhL